MRRFIWLVAGLLAAVLAAGGAAVAEAQPATETDKRGDVRITDIDGLTWAQRRTVDLRRLTVTPTEGGPMVELRLKRVVTDGPFDQYFYVYFEGEGDGFPLAYFRVKASTLRGPGGIEGSDNPEGFASCRVRGDVSDHRHTLTVLMPAKCAPRGPVNVRVLAYTTPLGAEGGGFLYSSDRMRLPDVVEVQD